MGYTDLWGEVTKEVGTGVQLFYYPAAPPFHVTVVLSGNRVVRFLCVWVATPCYDDACVCVGVAAEFARLRPTIPEKNASKRVLLLAMPRRRDCAKSASESNIDLNMR